MRHRPRPSIRPAQLRRCARRLAVVQADGERLAHFLSRETAYYYHRAQVADAELAEWRGKARLYLQQRDALLAHARTAWQIAPGDWAALVGERDGAE